MCIPKPISKYSEMKKLLIPSLLLAALPAVAAINVSMPANPTAVLSVTETPIGVDSIVAQTSLTLVGGKGAYVTQSLEPARIIISQDNAPIATVYSASPKDELTVIIPAEGAATYGGSELMDGINTLSMAAAPIEAEAMGLQALAATDPAAAQAQYEKLVEKYKAIFTDFIAANPGSPAVTYAMLNLDAPQFMEVYSSLSPEARTSILMPLVERQKAGVEKQLAAEKRIAEMQNGTFEAPAFTLPDLEGKQVSLSDFRGKWVVLDFWGAWCRWCIKGFPELKSAYSDYAGKIEVIGIDNRDTPERWREAVAKYALPWVNLYNDTEQPAGTALLESYAVQGFPTKVVIDPQGIIRNITVGEDPDFFSKLKELVK